MFNEGRRGGLIGLARTVASWLAALAAAGLVNSCASSVSWRWPANTRPIVKIGLIAPFEELYRADGYATLYAVKLALRERNAAGGVAGQQVALVALNDNGRPAEAALQAAKLGVDPDVIGVIGPLQRATAVAAAPVLAREGLAWVTPLPLTAGECLTGFSLFATPQRLGQEAIAALATAGADGPIAVFTDQAEALDGAQAAAERWGLSIVSWPLDTPPERRELREVAGVVWLGDAATGARLALALQHQSQTGRPRIPLVGGPELGSPVFRGRAGAAADQVRYLSSGPDSTQIPPGLAARYRKLAGFDPTPQAMLVYDATHLLLDALANAAFQARKGVTADEKRVVADDPVSFFKAGRANRQGVAEAMATLGQGQWTGVSGVVRWTETAGGCYRWSNAPLRVFTLGVTTR